MQATQNKTYGRNISYIKGFIGESDDSFAKLPKGEKSREQFEMQLQGYKDGKHDQQVKRFIEKYKSDDQAQTASDQSATSKHSYSLRKRTHSALNKKLDDMQLDSANNTDSNYEESKKPKKKKGRYQTISQPVEAVEPIASVSDAQSSSAFSLSSDSYMTYQMYLDLLLEYLARNGNQNLGISSAILLKALSADRRIIERDVQNKIQQLREEIQSLREEIQQLKVKVNNNQAQMLQLNEAELRHLEPAALVFGSSIDNTSQASSAKSNDVNGGKWCIVQ